MSWFKPENPQEKVLNSLLSPLSVLYFAGTLGRLKGYETRVLQQKSVEKSVGKNVAVFSIGNLTVGGTGKTPITIHFARSLMQEGLKVGVLSRGFNRQSNEKLVVVSDGKKILADAQQAGDEPYLIASKVPGAVVIVSADRFEGGRVAVKDYGCNVLILDDGFQHLKLERDYDVLVYDYNDIPSELKLLPAGRLREPLASIARASCLVISKVPENPCPNRMKEIRLMANRYKPGIEILTSRFEADGLHQVYNQPNVTITTRGEGTRVFAFCGIARPEGFYKNLEECGCVIVGKKSFPDHHWLSQSEMDRLVKDFEKSAAQYLVTTEKDRVRLSEEFIDRVPLAELAIATSWDGKELIDLPEVRRILKKLRNPVAAGAAR